VEGILRVGADGRDGREQIDAVPGLSPTAARRRLGTALRELRESTQLTLDDAGKPLQRSAATISRLENGKVKPRLIDVGVLLDLYADRRPDVVTEDQRSRVLELATESRREAWFSPFRDVLAGSMISDHMRRYVEFETDASRIESYEPDVVPGLLQTESYIRAIAESYYRENSPEQHQRFVQFRLARQNVLRRREEPLQLHVVLGELVLRRPIGGPEVMREQLSAIADQLRNGLPNVTIQVAPASLLTRGAIGGPFVVMSFADSQDNDLVYLEGRSGAEYLHSEHDLTEYRALFHDLASSALDREASLAMLEEVVKTLE
jgi:transcriptional regulator with XRE-family HTH domain